MFKYLIFYFSILNVVFTSTSNAQMFKVIDTFQTNIYSQKLDDLKFNYFKSSVFSFDKIKVCISEFNFTTKTITTTFLKNSLPIEKNNPAQNIFVNDKYFVIAYFNYLNVYKRNGTFLHQIVTNISPPYGKFYNDSILVIADLYDYCISDGNPELQLMKINVAQNDILLQKNINFKGIQYSNLFNKMVDFASDAIYYVQPLIYKVFKLNLNFDITDSIIGNLDCDSCKLLNTYLVNKNYKEKVFYDSINKLGLNNDSILKLLKPFNNAKGKTNIDFLQAYNKRVNFIEKISLQNDKLFISICKKGNMFKSRNLDVYDLSNKKFIVEKSLQDYSKSDSIENKNWYNFNFIYTFRPLKVLLNNEEKYVDFFLNNYYNPTIKFKKEYNKGIDEFMKSNSQTYLMFTLYNTEFK